MSRGLVMRCRSAVAAAGAAAILVSLSVTASAQVVPADAGLVLEQVVDGEVRCVSTGEACTDVDLYATDGERERVPLRPGDQQVTTVQLRNGGSVASSGLELTAGPCRNQPLEEATGAGDLCGTATVALACASGGSSLSVGPVALARLGQEGPRAVGRGLAPGSSVTCDVTVTYPHDASPTTQAMRAVQPVTWTLLAPEDAVLGTDIGGDAGGPAAGRLPVTGGLPLPLVITGLAVAAVGGALHRWARRSPAFRGP